MKNVKHILVPHPCVNVCMCICVKTHSHIIQRACVEWNCAILLSHKTTNYIAVNKFPLSALFPCCCSTSSLCLGDVVVSPNKYSKFKYIFHMRNVWCVRSRFFLSVCLATAVKWCLKCFFLHEGQAKWICSCNGWALIAWKRVPKALE